MKLAVVVQRYGPAIHGGAELHARYIAEHLVRHTEIEVLTTCAADDTTWADEYTDGIETINGVSVRRFRASRTSNGASFARVSARVFRQHHSLQDELDWLNARGPVCRALVRHVRKHADSYDFCLFFGYSCWLAYFGARIVPGRALLVPRAEKDDAVGLRIFRDIFRGVRAIFYDSPEERSLIHAVSGNHHVPGIVAGVGSEAPANPQPSRFRHKTNIRGPFAMYLGRVDERSGCAEMFAHFERYARDRSSRLSLVVAGRGPLAIPTHPKITSVGELDDADTFDALAAAEALVVPSRFESLSRTALDAWAVGTPVLANAESDVLRGQCLRSNGGLLYRSAEEFVAMLQAIEQNRWLSASLGRSGRQWVRDHYDWRVVERKYRDLLIQLQKNPSESEMPPLPGWAARRRKDVPPASDIVRSVP